MTPDTSNFLRKKEELEALQDHALATLCAAAPGLFGAMKLCGGTALSRFHLHHRLSYDLDFFHPPGFDAQEALARLSASGLRIEDIRITHDAVKADQLHFVVVTDRGDVKASMVEDMYAQVFPAIESGLAFRGVRIMTEAIEGLYHRKLRTIVGSVGQAALAPSGGRQTARDLFDLYVLSIATQPLLPFIEALPYVFPIQAFYEGLANMPWFEITVELEGMVPAPKWRTGCDVNELQKHLYAQLGMIEIPDETVWNEDADGTAPE
jgi:predicted nucleotidyltransferase component of viral defense system